MKLFLSFAFLFLLDRACLAQDTIPLPLTMQDRLASQSGVSIRFEDQQLPRLVLHYGLYADTRVRKAIVGGEVKLYYQISNGRRAGSVDPNEFVALARAFEGLKSQAQSDTKYKVDYIENKYITQDGLQIGYFVEKGRVTWFVRLDRYGIGQGLFLKSIESLEESLSQASLKLADFRK